MQVKSVIKRISVGVPEIRLSAKYGHMKTFNGQTGAYFLKNHTHNFRCQLSDSEISSVQFIILVWQIIFLCNLK